MARPGDPQLGSHFVDGAGGFLDPALSNAQVTCGTPPATTDTPTNTPTPTRTATRTVTPTATPTATDVPAVPDLIVTTSDTLDPVGSTGLFEYQLVVQNIGNGNAPNAQVEDMLPAGVDPVQPLPQGCSYNALAQSVRCDLGDIPGGQFGQVDLAVSAPKTYARGPEDNQLLSSCATADPDNAISEVSESNNSSCEDTTVLWNCPDMSGDGLVSLPDLAFMSLHWRHEIGVDEDGDGDAGDRIADLDMSGTVSLPGSSAGYPGWSDRPRPLRAWPVSSPDRLEPRARGRRSDGRRL